MRAKGRCILGGAMGSEARARGADLAGLVRRAIYATTDGLWVIYFAILDRHEHPEVSLFNTCLQARVAADEWSDPVYFYSITHSVLLQRPWREGGRLRPATHGLPPGSSATGAGHGGRLPPLDQLGSR